MSTHSPPDTEFNAQSTPDYDWEKIDSELVPFHSDVLKHGTTLQRFILLAARDAVLREQPLVKEISEVADCSQSYVNPALRKFVARDSLPVPNMVGAIIHHKFRESNRFIKTKTFDDLTPKQSIIVSHSALNPYQTQESICEVVAQILGEDEKPTPQHVSVTQLLYKDIIRDLRPSDVPPELPLRGVSDDVSLDMLQPDDLPSNVDLTELIDSLPIAVTKPLSFAFRESDDIDSGIKFTILAAREWLLRGECTVDSIMKTTEQSRMVVRKHLGYVAAYPEKYPVAAAIARAAEQPNDFDDLTGTPRHIILEYAANSNQSMTDVAENVECDQATVHYHFYVNHTALREKQGEFN